MLQRRLWAFRPGFSNGQIKLSKLPDLKPGPDRILANLSRFRAKRIPVRVKKTRQKMVVEPRF
jgi:hypothetical protein